MKQTTVASITAAKENLFLHFHSPAIYISFRCMFIFKRKNARPTHFFSDRVTHAAETTRVESSLSRTFIIPLGFLLIASNYHIEEGWTKYNEPDVSLASSFDRLDRKTFPLFVSLKNNSQFFFFLKKYEIKFYSRNILIPSNKLARGGKNRIEVGESVGFCARRQVFLVKVDLTPSVGRGKRVSPFSFFSHTQRKNCQSIMCNLDFLLDTTRGEKAFW